MEDEDEDDGKNNVYKTVKEKALGERSQSGGIKKESINGSVEDLNNDNSRKVSTSSDKKVKFPKEVRYDFIETILTTFFVFIVISDCY